MEWILRRGRVVPSGSSEYWKTNICQVSQCLKVCYTALAWCVCFVLLVTTSIMLTSKAVLFSHCGPNSDSKLPAVIRELRELEYSALRAYES